ncbi:diaminopimelate decarboxylase [Microbacterium amylolyticum]|uniref:Diaminopimelate decarboxylase n=1 Tax=Microbacterium amylolyticum TaxID=936337 RepID=A0ABS4ZG46_9MICO|nr:diaminopimelate decarboxylase [Microbacterium amylolyticum]MBP2436257.1 diaminopimelate decarboxylase [Microbacterium amylolyticum]
MVSESVSPLAPEWLVAPADANGLASLVWPRSASRDNDGMLVIAGARADDLVREFGTPVVVIDEHDARSRAAETLAAFDAAASRHGGSARVYYAGKVFMSADVARWMTAEGLNIDVCSRGELETALAAGTDPARIGFHGNNKSLSELERAVTVGVGTIIVDSAIEIERLDAITRRHGRTQRVLVRVRSGVHADTHSFLATAHEDQKFGFSLAEGEQAAARIRETEHVEFIGLHCHIGSQIFGVAGFRESATRLLEVHARLLESGDVPVLNLGGGFGIAYTSVDDPADIRDLADGIVDAVAEECDRRGIPLPILAFEPGRSIFGPAGVTLYEVGTTKPITVETPSGSAQRLYVSVDGGMSDNARPALYGAQFSARIASRTSSADPALVRVVGMHCESGDIVVDNEYLPGDVTPGDLLAVPSTGAYTVALSSNYNHVPRPPVVAVRDGAARVIIRGEQIEDLLARDAGITRGVPAHHEGEK